MQHRRFHEIDRGLYEPFVVENVHLSPYSHDMVWMLDDWLLAPDGQVDADFDSSDDVRHIGRWGDTRQPTDPPVTERDLSRVGSRTGRVERLGRSASRLAVIVIIASTALLGACGSDAAPRASGETSGFERGAEIYASACASCHGVDLRGTDKGPSFLSIVYEPNHHSDESFRSAITKGAPQHHWPFGDMPVVEGLSDDDIAFVIAYVRSEQQRLGFEG